MSIENERIITLAFLQQKGFDINNINYFKKTFGTATTLEDFVFKATLSNELTFVKNVLATFQNVPLEILKEFYKILQDNGSYLMADAFLADHKNNTDFVVKNTLSGLTILTVKN